jgi:hypothetical protein
MAMGKQAMPQKAAKGGGNTSKNSNTRSISAPAKGAPVMKMAMSKGKGC